MSSGRIDELTGGSREGPDVASLFGEPYELRGHTVIPVARVQQVVAFGPRVRKQQTGDTGESTPGKRRPFVIRTTASPVAILKIDERGVQVTPVGNSLPVLLAGIALGGWNIFWIARTIREWMRWQRPGQDDS